MDLNTILFFKDSALIALLWAVIGSAYFVWGHYLHQLFSLKTDDADTFFSKIWLGWGFSIVFFCIWHFFFPINWVGSVIFYVPASVIFLIYHRKSLIELIHSKKSILSFMAILMIIAGLWGAVKYQECPDTGFYHLNTIRWYNEYAIVPGLGNIHTRLGFNQLNYVNCASINFYPYLKYPGNHAGTAFLYVLLMLNCIFACKCVDSLLLASCVFIPIPAKWLSSPTTDWYTALLQVAAFRYFYVAISKKFAEENEYSYISMAAILAALSVVVKLNSVFFALGLGMITLIMALKYKLNNDSSRQLKKVFGFIGIITCLWIIRGYILTGCPLFPSIVGKIDFEWAVGDKYAKIAEDSVYVYARLDNYEFDNEYLKDYKWFKSWWIKNIDFPINHYRNVIKNEYNLSIMYWILSLLKPGLWCQFFLSVFVLDGIGIILFLISIIGCIVRKKIKESLPIVLVALICIVCFGIWFYLAPTARFLGGLPVIFFVSCFMFFDRIFEIKFSSEIVKVLVCVAPIISILVSYPVIQANPYTGIFIPQPLPHCEKMTDNGLKVAIIIDQMWLFDYSLIATLANEYNPKLRMLGNTYQDGFAGK